MRLNLQTDYGLRVLLFVDKSDGSRTIGQIASYFDLSKAHLQKIVRRLAEMGFVEAKRGRGGGIVLARDPSSIRIGDVVRALESDLELVECFRDGDVPCRLSEDCRLSSVLSGALSSFLKHLDGFTLKDISLSEGFTLEV